MDFIACWQRLDSFNNMTYENKLLKLQQADVIIYSDSYLIALSYIEYRGYSPIVVYKSSNVKQDLIHAGTSRIKTIKNTNLANSLYLKNRLEEEIKPEFYREVAKIYADINFYSDKSKEYQNYIIGMRYYYGTCDEIQDYILAVKYLRKAAQKNYSDAQFQLGYCYLLGNGVKRSWKIAQRWFVKAAENGNIKAKLYLSQEV